MTTEVTHSPLKIWIGDLTDYKRAMRLEREEYKRILVYDYDSKSTARYLFHVDFDDERPHWKLLIRDGIFRAYDIINTGGEFEWIQYPGYRISRNKTELSKLH